jgi:hypothetical protein
MAAADVAKSGRKTDLTGCNRSSAMHLRLKSFCATARNPLVNEEPVLAVWRGFGAWKDMGRGPGSRAGELIEWLTIKDQNQIVINDVARIRSHPAGPSRHGDLWIALRRGNRSAQ